MSMPHQHLTLFSYDTSMIASLTGLMTHLPVDVLGVSRMDTMHLASCYEGSEADGGSSGCDISHRGGPPGFVQQRGDGELFWADYVGNYTFTTLGRYSSAIAIASALTCLVLL